MLKIVILAFFFGKKPSYYPMWEKSVFFNNTVDFVLFTDFADVQSHKNLTVINCTFTDIQKLVKEKFDLKIALEFPYKFADFRPAWADIFPEYVDGYDYWGYCDLDMCLGDIRGFLTDDILKSHDKFYENGHFTVYKNTPDVNAVYKNSECCYPEYSYEEAFTSSEQLYFDEFRGILPKFIREKRPVYCDRSVVFDPPPEYLEMKMGNGENAYVEFESGKVYMVYGRGKENYRKELIYFHCQKRNLDNPYPTAKDLPDNFVITPNRIWAKDKIAMDEAKKSLTGHLFSKFHKMQYFLHYYFKKITTNRYGIRGMLRRKQHAKDSQVYIQTLRKELG